MPGDMAIDEPRLKAAIKTWIGDSLAPLLREGGVQRGPAVEQFLNELSELTRVDNEGAAYAPDQYTLSVHPDAMVGVGESITHVHNALSRSFEQLLANVGYKLTRRLHITLATDPTLKEGSMHVIAWHSGDPLNVTRELDPEKVGETGVPPEGAFLMVAGQRHMTLSQPEVRIGRLRENDLVLDDPHISRRHALVRLENSRYVLYDLKSTAGTKVNDVDINSHTLRPGDVIRVANIEIVYGEEPGRPPEEALEYTPPKMPEAPEHDVTPLDLRKLDSPTWTYEEPKAEDDQEE